MTTPTTELTFDDLRAQYTDELADLREAWQELTDWISDEYGDDALDWDPTNADLDDEGMEQLATVQATREAYDEAGKAIQQRQHALETLADEYGSDPFELRMLTGQELMDIETDLRMEANRKDVDVSLLQAQRRGSVVDTATVTAPEGVPTGEGGPTPSECPNPLTMALYDQAEVLNNTGSVDFRAPGFGDEASGGRPSTSGTPTTSGLSSSASAPTDADAQPSGDS